MGLDREDIGRVTALVRETQPDLNVDRRIGTFPMLGDGFRAITNPITRNTTIDNYWNKDNIPAGQLINLGH